jgi:hypothetical protein
VKRFLLVPSILFIGLLFGAGIGPASAHEEINPSTFPVNKPVFLTITAANEKQVRLTKLTLTAPQGLAFGATTRSPSGWTANRTDTAVTWTGGSVDPDRFESFGFEIEGADQPGSLTYKATLGYADGSNDDVTVAVTATAAGAAASGSGSSGSGRANAALALGAVALVAAIAALVLAGRRRGAGVAAAKATPGAEQDW